MCDCPLGFIMKIRKRGDPGINGWPQVEEEDNAQIEDIGNQQYGEKVLMEIQEDHNVKSGIQALLKQEHHQEAQDEVVTIDLEPQSAGTCSHPLSS